MYVRLLNAGCVEADGVKVQVQATYPKSELAHGDMTPVTLPNGIFVSDSFWGTDGAWVPGPNPWDNALTFLGPFTWTPDPNLVNASSGQICFRVKINSPDDPIGLEMNVAANNNIAQRCIQTNPGSRWMINNAESNLADVGLKFRCNDFPMYEPGAEFYLLTAFNQNISDAWQQVPGTVLTTDPNTSELRLKLDWCNVDLPAFQMYSGNSINARVETTLPSGQSGEFRSHFFQHNDYGYAQEHVGGATFHMSQ